MEIKEDFDKVIQYSQGIPEPKTERLFNIWLEKKKHFIDAFGGLIYEYPEKVSFKLDEKAKHEKIASFIENVNFTWNNAELAEFIEEQEEGFYNNLTIKDSKGKDCKLIKKGEKLVRAFRHFETNEKTLSDIQNEASRIIQEDRVEGTLCLSVHPLDFLSLSENTYKWHSCHSLDGDYRAGNLSYMMDDCTFICYLKGADNVKLPLFPEDVPWNSKKWRVLMFDSIDGNLIMAGRQYPYTSTPGLNFILKEVFPKVGLCADNWTDWIQEVKSVGNLNLSFEYVVLGAELYPVGKFVRDAKNSCQFNDLLESPTYIPYYTCALDYYNNPKTNFFLTDIEIGNETYCLYCGKKIIPKGGGTMMCEECNLEYNIYDDTIISCDCCGRRIYIEDAYRAGDEFLCEGCIDEYYSICDQCDEYYRNEEIFYDSETDQYLCRECLEELNNGSSRN